ncbi:MAG: hypothetical protein ACRDZY_02725 [Acidimicrobiales bacterium]
MVTMTIDEMFPRYDSLWPTDPPGHVTVDRRALLSDTECAAGELAATKTRFGFVALDITTTGVSVVPVLQDRPKAVTATEVPAQVQGLAGCRYQFDPRWLTEALASFLGHQVTLYPKGGSHLPVLFVDRPEALTDPTCFRHLLMSAAGH